MLIPQECEGLTKKDKPEAKASMKITKVNTLSSPSGLDLRIVRGYKQWGFHAAQ